MSLSFWLTHKSTVVSSTVVEHLSPYWLRNFFDNLTATWAFLHWIAVLLYY